MAADSLQNLSCRGVGRSADHTSVPNFAATILQRETRHEHRLYVSPDCPHDHIQRLGSAFVPLRGGYGHRGAGPFILGLETPTTPFEASDTLLQRLYNMSTMPMITI